MVLNCQALVQVQVQAPVPTDPQSSQINIPPKTKKKDLDLAWADSKILWANSANSESGSE